MNYKSKNLGFLTNETKISSLCYYNGYYYFECLQEIAEAENVSEEEFAEAKASVIHVETESVPTQLDRIEEAVNKSNTEIANEAVAGYQVELSHAYKEGVNSI